MSDILDIICTIVSAPRPEWVTGDMLLAALREPDPNNANKATIAEAVFTEVAVVRLAELVGTGALQWSEVARSAALYGHDDTESAKLARGMSR